MGQEIFYCCKCQIRLLGDDLEGGQGIKIGNRVACRTCAPDVLAALPPEERPVGPKPRKTSTQRIPVVRPMTSSSTSTRAAPPRREEPPPPPPKSNANLYIGLGVGGVALVLLLAMMMSGGSTSTRTRDPEPAPRRPRPEPEEEPRSASSSPLDRVKKLVKERPDDVDGNAAAAQEAFQRAEGTSYAPEAKELREAVLALQRTVYAREFSAVEKEVAAPADRGDFARAGAVLEAARKKHATEEWASRINGKLAELKTREAASKPPPPVPPPPTPAPVAEKPWTALFDGKTNEVLNSQSHADWQVVDGALVKLKEAGGAAQSRMDIAEGEVRIRFEVGDLASAYFKVRQAAGGYSVSFDKPTLAAMEGKPHEIVFVMKGDVVTATLDGQPAVVLAEGKLTTGRIQFNGQGRMLRILAIETR